MPPAENPTTTMSRPGIQSRSWPRSFSAPVLKLAARGPGCKNAGRRPWREAKPLGIFSLSHLRGPRRTACRPIRWPRLPRRPTPSRSTAPTTSSSRSATPSRQPLLPRRLRVPTGRVPRPRDGSARPGELPAPAGQDPLRADDADPPRPERRSSAHRRSHPPSWRRRPRPRAVGGRRPRGVRQGGRARRAAGTRAPGSQDEDGEIVIAAIRTYGDTIHSLVERRELPRPVHAGLPAGEAALPAGACRAQVRRPLRRQRRARQDERVGGVLRRRDGLPEPPHVRRQGHLDRVLVADVEGDGRTGTTASSSRSTSRRRGRRSRRSTSISSSIGARRAAHRARHRRHHRDRDRAPRPRRRVPVGADDATTRSSRAASARSTSRSTCSPRSASWSIATPTATCCRSSPSRSRIARRCSTRSSSARAPRSFGKGNFKALFEAIEREQAARGNL